MSNVLHNDSKVIGYGVGADGIIGFVTENDEVYEMQLSDLLSGDFNNDVKDLILNKWKSLYDTVINPNNLPYDREGINV